MSFVHSVVLIVAAEDKAAAESFGAVLGHSGREYTVALSGSGAEPASHYALHSWATDGFARLLRGTALQGTDRAGLERLLELVTVSIRPDADNHFAEAVRGAGLKRIVPADPPAVSAAP